MAKGWTNSGLDLLLDLRGGAGRRVDVEAALRAAVRAGSVLPGSRLPSTRTLARDLGVARGTIVEAYAQLVAEGYLESRVGSGTMVVWSSVANHPSEPLPKPDVGTPITFDWTPGSPDVSSFPRREWLHSLRRVLSVMPSSALDYGDARGCEELRVSLASYLSRARGVRADPERVVICSGYCQALGLIGQTLRARGSAGVVVENPGLLWHRSVLHHAGLETRAIDVDQFGLPVSQLTAKDSAVLVTPSHQYPTGVVLAPSRRSSLIDWANAADAVVIEDDYDGEFRYDREPVRALQELDPNRVVYVGTTSKTLAPGLRLAWIVAPTRLLKGIIAAKALADQQGSTIDQLVLSDLILAGAFDKHVRRMRAHYRARRDQLVEGVKAAIPGMQVEGIAGGLHVVLRLPSSGPSEADIVAAGSERGLALTGMAFFSGDMSSRLDALVVGYARPPRHTYARALGELLRLLSDLLG